MVGLPVTIECDEAWEGLTKNLVCRCSSWDDEDVEIRTILNVGNAAVVAHEVMQAGKHLYLGLEGFTPDGELVIPTTWAMCGVIEKGANTGEDISADPTLPVWNQLQTQIEQLESSSIPQELLDEIQASVVTAVEAASSAERSKKSASSASALAVNSAESAEVSADSARTSMEDARNSVSSAAYLANETLRLQRAAEAAAERAETAADSLQGRGVTTEQVNALDGMFRVCAFVKDDVSTEYNAFRAAFGLDGSGGDGDKTLTSISATYSGGSVPVGTAVSALTGIVVTAHYSDGFTAVVTGYSLSGSIAEGSNTITVAYGGVTATITVVGVAEESGLEQYEYTIAGSGNLDVNGGLFGGPYNYTDYIQIDPDYAAVTLAAYLTAPAESNTTVYSYIQWFNGDTFISRPDSMAYIEIGKVVAVRVNPVPAGATKFRISVQNNCERFALYKGEVSAEEVA